MAVDGSCFTLSRQSKHPQIMLDKFTAEHGFKLVKAGFYGPAFSSGSPCRDLGPPMSKLKTMALDILLARHRLQISAASEGHKVAMGMVALPATLALLSAGSIEAFSV